MQKKGGNLKKPSTSSDPTEFRKSDQYCYFFQSNLICNQIRKIPNLKKNDLPYSIVRTELVMPNNKNLRAWFLCQYLPFIGFGCPFQIEITLTAPRHPYSIFQDTADSIQLLINGKINSQKEKKSKSSLDKLGDKLFVESFYKLLVNSIDLVKIT